MAPTETEHDLTAPVPMRSQTSGPNSLGEHLLSMAARHSGVALQFRRDGATAYISYPELGTISSASECRSATGWRSSA